ncbi:MAG: choice-of-anchor tandem repeat GloVer-containing protein [Candidatus Sulfotelmatobacter sp.]
MKSSTQDFKSAKRQWSLASIWRRCRWTAIAALTVGLAQAQTFSVLYGFKGQPDGASPYGGVVEDASGNLYGTTQAGGISNLGTVFKLDPADNETVLHSFTGGADGATPLASVVMDPAGNLYGTTNYGGSACDCGVVFKMDPSGSETILHSFTGQSDGGSPRGSLILDSAGNLYGTTIGGGNGSGGGVVFKLDPTGQETVLYAFTLANGGSPEAGLLRDSAGNLYGTTTFGGGAGLGSGTVFKLDSAGNFSTLHAFSGGTDGGVPTSVLIQDNAGNLYGTTMRGGIFFDECDFGCGVVFKLDSSGNESVLYSFCSVIVSGLCSDGASPYAGVVEDGSGNLYGTTAGTTSVIFELSSGGNETVLYNFPTGSGLSTPFGGLIRDAAGNFFGTAYFGVGQGGSGVVFKLVPPGFSLAATALTPNSVPPGGSATATVSVTDTGGFTGAASLTCSVQPQPAMAPTCSITNSVAPGTPATLAVNTTGPTAAVSHRTGASGLLYALWLPLIGLVVSRFGGKGNEGRTGILTVVLACAMLAGLASGVGCSGGSSSRGSVGTPAGTYTITITGTSVSSSLQNSTTTTLTVN